MANIRDVLFPIMSKALAPTSLRVQAVEWVRGYIRVWTPLRAIPPIGHTAWRLTEVGASALDMMEKGHL